MLSSVFLERFPERQIANRVTVLLRCESIRRGAQDRRAEACSETIRLMTELNEQTPVRAMLLVSGRVQGVGYRAFCVRVATQRRLSGGVKNLDDGRVELEVEGTRDLIHSLVDDLKKGPPAARVTTVQVEWTSATGRYDDFRVRY